MIDCPDKKEDLFLLEYVKALENKSNPARGQIIQALLESYGIKPSIQECRPLKIKNIVVDFSPGYLGKRLIFSAHYDAVKGSPGANDNASGAAVLLGLCSYLKKERIPLTIIFFDREEAWFKTPFFRLGLLGSIFYVWRNNVQNTAAVYNLEYCGQGDFLSIWPVNNEEIKLPAVKIAEKAAANLNINCKLAQIPWLLLSSDHLSFRMKGVTDSVTLSLLPQSQLTELEKMVSSLSLRKLLLRKKPVLPEPLSRIHTAGDTASQLNEKSLRLMLAILLEIIKNSDDQNGSQ